MSAVTEEESWKREMPRRSSAQHRSSAHRPKEGGTRQTAKPNANQCHSPVRAEVRGDLKRLPRTFFTPPPLSIPTFHRPRFTKRLGVFIALIYIRNVYTENARRHIYIYIRVRRSTCASFTPRYPQLLAKCLHALFEANVHEILMYSRAFRSRDRIRMRPSRLRTDIYTRNNIYMRDTREFVPFPPSLLQGIGGSIYKAVTNEP